MLSFYCNTISISKCEDHSTLMLSYHFFLYNFFLYYVTNESVYPTKENKAYIPLESLIVGNYASKKNFTDNVDKDKDGSDDLCKGYSVVYYNGEEEQYSIESFVSCDKYTSKYYNDYLDYLEK